jgi:hypothetical protein
MYFPFLSQHRVLPSPGLVIFWRLAFAASAFLPSTKFKPGESFGKGAMAQRTRPGVAYLARLFYTDW